MNATVSKNAVNILLDLLSDYRRDERLFPAIKEAEALSKEESSPVVLGVLDLLYRLEKYNIKRIRREAVDYARLLTEVSFDMNDQQKLDARKSADKIFIAFVSRLFKDRAMMFEVVCWQNIFSCMDDILAYIIGEKGEVA